MQFGAQVTAGHQVGRQSSFIEKCVPVRLQKFQANRRFEFSDLQLPCRRVAVIHVGVIKLGSGTGKFRDDQQN